MRLKKNVVSLFRSRKNPGLCSSASIHGKGERKTRNQCDRDSPRTFSGKFWTFTPHYKCLLSGTMVKNTERERERSGDDDLDLVAAISIILVCFFLYAKYVC